MSANKQYMTGVEDLNSPESVSSNVKRHEITGRIIHEDA